MPSWASALCLGVAALALGAEVPQDAALDPSLFEADDECDAAGGEAGCALSAAQLRARALQAGEKQQHEGDLEGNSSTWPFSSSSAATKWHAKCFGNIGAAACADPAAPPGAGKCACPNGCMGADGSCYTNVTNKLVASKFTIKNAKWPDYKMYVQRMSVFNQMKTTSFSSGYNMGQDKFSLYQLPGKFNGETMFFLGSDKWPDYVFALDSTGGTAVSLWGGYAVSLTEKHEPWSLKDVMLRVCSARKTGHPDAIMIGSSVPSGGSTVWAYIHSGSWLVYGYWYPERLLESKAAGYIPGMGGSSSASKPTTPAPTIASVPGEGGYWIPEPPLPRGLLKDC